MFEFDLILSYVLMGFLFLRQVVILKQPNKLNYSPLMLGIGAIFAIIHFVLYIQDGNALLILKESLTPTLISLLLYIFMNVLHQAQSNEDEQLKMEFSSSIAQKVVQMKEYISLLENKIEQIHKDEQDSLFEVRQQIHREVGALQAIGTNQESFLKQFEDITQAQQKVSKTLEDLISVQLLDLDKVMHSHIDILRISEQDHFNRLKKAFDAADTARCDIKDELGELKTDVESIKHISHDVASAIVKSVLSQFSIVTENFSQQLKMLKVHTEDMSDTLKGSVENLTLMQKKSETVTQQMHLTANELTTLKEYTSHTTAMFESIQELMNSMELIKDDYQEAYQELTNLASLLSTSEKEQIENMKSSVEELSKALVEKIDTSLQKLHTHYHIASSEVTSTVSELTKKAKIQSGYEEH